ncbi:MULTISPECIES: glutamine synthetase III family protein [Clostridiaceae]|uniref:Glutamine synthetase III n=1 Tax=Clostridium facile TaxID=2763035 RepID=A0ABR7IR56_9CLOT|nr:MULTISPECIES: glutamine synthetase III [Clostridiaceae]MBC5787636.1 glutamine synthetase III [Clostridium facile]
MNTITNVFGTDVFNDSVMKARLPKETYRQLQRTMKEGKHLDNAVANVVANAMKDWAVEKGATHFTHWFQPMTGITAEKHDSFITPTNDGRVILEFSGKELIQGEPDASSFPSGGLRATFEARGYTAWDPTSYAFIKDKTLCIPTAFCSYGGEALDKKTPLLRSMEAINRQAVRILKLFGDQNITSVKTTVGPEQEYFLVDKDLYDKRPDLIYTGRTLFGAKPPKGQELDDHYFGTIKSKVAAFMDDLNQSLWKLGVLAKTEHNEVAPAQHELAPIFTTTNIATDHNQLTMELMQRIAKKHGMICLLHEKPFAGVNGSGKHNNWSISTNTGKNLLEPGDTPHENAQFLLFLCAVIKAVDDYQDLLRISVASAGNDHRLGANEAPPAIVSMFLGTELTDILDSIEKGEQYGTKEKELWKVGVHILPRFPKDTTDRNRTSPFAFTGNKFEFRMLGSSDSIACTNMMLNTAVAESLRQFADVLENATDFNETLHDLIQDTIKKHKRIIFNGNGYDESWVQEAEKRGLLNLKTTPDCLPYYINEKNIKLLTEHKVLTETEIHARYEIILDNYSKTLNIEAVTMLDMAKKDLLPAFSAYTKQLSDTLLAKKEAAPGVDCSYEEEQIKKVSGLCGSMYQKTKGLEESLMALVHREYDELEKAKYYRTEVFQAMNDLRIVADEIENVMDRKLYPYPNYGDLLFGVR